MSTIEERIESMNLQRVKKGNESSSQQYEQEMTIPKNKNKLLLEKDMTLTCMIKGKATRPSITFIDMMEECDNILYL